jgi:ParB/RepB/Spo0J family partition protein
MTQTVEPTTEPVTSGLQMIPFSSTFPSPLNPRKTFDQAAIEELAGSILAQGILQNMVARPVDGRFEVIAGGRRWRAVNHLVTGGQLPEDYLVPVRVQELTDLQALEMATLENVGRKDMSPIEEADAFAQIADMGESVHEIAAKFGYSSRLIQRRIDISRNLIPEAKEALQKGTITLAKAEVIALAGPSHQKELLYNAGYMEVPSLKNALTRGRFLEKHAVFYPLSLYTGEVVADLFGDFPAYFSDKKQAMELQTQALERKVQEELANGAAFAEFTSTFRSWDWNLEPQGDEPIGVIFQLDNQTGEVTRHEVARKVQETSVPQGPQLNYSGLEAIRHSKSHTFRDALAQDPVVSFRVHAMSEIFRMVLPSGVPGDVVHALRRTCEPLTSRGLVDLLEPRNANEQYRLRTLVSRGELLNGLMNVPEVDLCRLLGFTAVAYTSNYVYNSNWQTDEKTMEVALAERLQLKAANFTITREWLLNHNTAALVELIKEAGIDPEQFVGQMPADVIDQLLDPAREPSFPDDFVPSSTRFLTQADLSPATQEVEA